MIVVPTLLMQNILSSLVAFYPVLAILLNSVKEDSTSYSNIFVTGPFI